MTRRLSVARSSLDLEHSFADAVHSVKITLGQQTAVRVGRQAALESRGARTNEIARLATSTEAKSFEAHQNYAREAVVDLSEIDVRDGESSSTEEFVPQQACEVVSVVVIKHVVTNIEARSRSGAVGR